jgi:hypothetical protein
VEGIEAKDEGGREVKVTWIGAGGVASGMRGEGQEGSGREQWVRGKVGGGGVVGLPLPTHTHNEGERCVLVRERE